MKMERPAAGPLASISILFDTRGIMQIQAEAARARILAAFLGWRRCGDKAAAGTRALNQPGRVCAVPGLAGKSMEIK